MPTKKTLNRCTNGFKVTLNHDIVVKVSTKQHSSNVFAFPIYEVATVSDLLQSPLLAFSNSGGAREEARACWSPATVFQSVPGPACLGCSSLLRCSSGGQKQQLIIPITATCFAKLSLAEWHQHIADFYKRRCESFKIRFQKMCCDRHRNHSAGDKLL